MLAALTHSAAAAPGVTARPAEGLDGATIWVYRIEGEDGFAVEVMCYGATLLSVETPDRHGKLENVVLRLETPADYVRGNPAMGPVIGRFANRIGGAKFTLDGVEHNVTANAGKNHIHGGKRGFSKRLWIAKVLDGQDGVRFTLHSADGDEGYPGAVDVAATYSVRGADTLTIEYEAHTDAPTHVNLTNHAYWNLGGAGAGDVLDHVLEIFADQYLDTDSAKVPTGKILDVAGTPLDFTRPTAIGARIEAVNGANYDHCYVLRGGVKTAPAPIARVYDPGSGRVMEVSGTHPGVQLYTAKGLNGRYGLPGIPYGPYHGLCLETQHFPNTPNVAAFPSTVLRPGETYRHSTVHKFSVRGGEE